MPKEDAGFIKDIGRVQLQVIASDLPATARELRDLLAKGSGFYDRGGVLVRLAQAADGGAPIAVEVTANGVVCEAHKLAQPMAWTGDILKPVTLPERVAKMLLDMRGDWRLPALDGITTAPVLTDDGAIVAHDGYDPATRLWCARVPALELLPMPTRTRCRESPSAPAEWLQHLPLRRCCAVDRRHATQDRHEQTAGAGRDRRPGRAADRGLPAEPAPGARASGEGAPISGAGAGKGLLVRAIAAVAFGVAPRAFTAGAERAELDKRLVAELIEAAPILLLDNVNDVGLKSDTLASVLTERPARVRVMGKSLMVPLNSTAFIAVTGNGLSVSEDLARRFLDCSLDAQMEDPESRPFKPGFLAEVIRKRPELLTAALARSGAGDDKTRPTYSADASWGALNNGRNGSAIRY